MVHREPFQEFDRLMDVVLYGGVDCCVSVLIHSEKRSCDGKTDRLEGQFS